MKKLLFFLVLFVFGCEIVNPFISNPLVNPVVDGITYWNEGAAHKFYNEEAIIMYRATKTAIRELNYVVNKDKIDHKNVFYISAGHKNRFQITIRSVEKNITEIKIRVDLFGDKPYAELLYQQIEQNINTINFNDSGVPVKIEQ